MTDGNQLKDVIRSVTQTSFFLGVNIDDVVNGFPWWTELLRVSHDGFITCVCLHYFPFNICFTEAVSKAIPLNISFSDL